MEALIITMPSQGNHTAPQFDAKQPRELHCYFSDLNYCFGQAQIADDAEKKKHACRFVDINTSKLWELLMEFNDITKTYINFCQAIYTLYPGLEEEYKWS